MFQDPAMIDEAPSLTAEHFHIPAHQIVFDLMRELHSGGKPIELVSFVQTLLDRGMIDRAGGPSSISDLQMRANFRSDIFASHIEILTFHLARRMTISTAEEMTRIAFESAEAQDLIAATSAPITAIHDTLTGTSPAKSTKAVLLGCFERFENLCKGKITPMGIETSLVEINRRFRGLHPKQTIVISAYPGGGKTTLAGQFAMDAATDGHNTLFVSLEMPGMDLMDRLLAYVARRPGDAIKDPFKYAREVLNTEGPTNDMLRAIKTAARKISEAPFHIEDMNGANVYQIASCIRRAHRKNPLKVVVVDFAQRIRPAPEKIRESREQQLAHASNYLADLSKELGFCLLLPSQLNREGGAKHAEAINEDADLHLQIRQDANHIHLGIAVVKDRHSGQDGTLLPIVLDGPMLRFVPKPFAS
jgi:replicative DNA helicase